MREKSALRASATVAGRGRGRSARTTNAIERLHEEFKRQIKTQTVLPTADTTAMLFWALLASGQINMCAVGGHLNFEQPAMCALLPLGLVAHRLAVPE